MNTEVDDGKGGGAWDLTGLNVWQAAEMFDHSEIGS